MVLAGGAAAVLTAVLIVSAYGDAPPPLAEETGDVQARAESGEELSGVRPYTLETEDGDEEYVYVLQLEGKPGFKQARKRWGFQANSMNNPPFVHPQEIGGYLGGLLNWLVDLPVARPGLGSRYHRPHGRWVACCARVSWRRRAQRWR